MASEQEFDGDAELLLQLDSRIDSLLPNISPGQLTSAVAEEESPQASSRYQLKQGILGIVATLSANEASENGQANAEELMDFAGKSWRNLQELFTKDGFIGTFKQLDVAVIIYAAMMDALNLSNNSSESGQANAQSNLSYLMHNWDNLHLGRNDSYRDETGTEAAVRKFNNANEIPFNYLPRKGVSKPRKVNPLIAIPTFDGNPSVELDNDIDMVQLWERMQILSAIVGSSHRDLIAGGQNVDQALKLVTSQGRYRGTNQDIIDDKFLLTIGNTLYYEPLMGDLEKLMQMGQGRNSDPELNSAAFLVAQHFLTIKLANQAHREAYALGNALFNSTRADTDLPTIEEIFRGNDDKVGLNYLSEQNSSLRQLASDRLSEELSKNAYSEILVGPLLQVFENLASLSHWTDNEIFGEGGIQFKNPKWAVEGQKNQRSVVLTHLIEIATLLAQGHQEKRFDGLDKLLDLHQKFIIQLKRREFHGVAPARLKKAAAVSYVRPANIDPSLVNPVKPSKSTQIPVTHSPVSQLSTPVDQRDKPYEPNRPEVTITTTRIVSRKTAKEIADFNERRKRSQSQAENPFHLKDKSGVPFEYGLPKTSTQEVRYWAESWIENDARMLARMARRAITKQEVTDDNGIGDMEGEPLATQEFLAKVEDGFATILGLQDRWSRQSYYYPYVDSLAWVDRDGLIHNSLSSKSIRYAVGEDRKSPLERYEKDLTDAMKSSMKIASQIAAGVGIENRDEYERLLYPYADETISILKQWDDGHRSTISFRVGGRIEYIPAVFSFPTGEVELGEDGVMRYIQNLVTFAVPCYRIGYSAPYASRTVRWNELKVPKLSAELIPIDRSNLENVYLLPCALFNLSDILPN